MRGAGFPSPRGPDAVGQEVLGEELALHDSWSVWHGVARPVGSANRV